MSKEQPIETMPRDREFLAKHKAGDWHHVEFFDDRCHDKATVKSVNSGSCFTPTAWAELPSAEPVTNDLRKQAMALYKPPFRCEAGVLLDSANNLVDEKIGFHLLHYLRKGWVKNDSQRPHSVLAEEFGEIVAQALNEFYEKHGEKK